MNERQRKLLEKVKSAIRLAESEGEIGNAEAAASIMQFVRDLVARNKLDMSAIEIEREDTDDPMGHTVFDPRDHDLPLTNMMLEWQQFLAVVVAEAHYCAAIGWSGANITYFCGRESDREIATYLYVFLLRTAMRLGKREWDAYNLQYMPFNRPGTLMYLPQKEEFLHSFYLGFAQKVQHRYLERGAPYDREARPVGDSPMPVNEETTTAMVRLSGALARSRAYALAFVNGSEVKVEAPRSLHKDAFDKGLEHGSQVNIDANALSGGEPGRAEEIED